VLRASRFVGWTENQEFIRYSFSDIAPWLEASAERERVTEIPQRDSRISAPV